MFAHIFVTRFKCIVRDRHNIFWTLMFPVILATLFHCAFANMGKAYVFSKFNIAVVNNAQLQNNTAFKNALDSVSGKSKKSGAQVLFNVTYCSKAKADALLKSSKIEGYIDYDTSPKLVVKTSDYDQSIMKTFLDEYRQTSDAAITIIKKNPSAAATIMSNIAGDKNYLKAVSQNGSKSKPDVFVNYYYALLAMACLFGGYFGLKEVSAIQANQSAQGARVNMAPVNKLKVFLSSICAATSVQVICALVLLAYLMLALKVDFGTKVPLVILACVVSSFTGVSFGAFLGSIIKAGEGLKISVLTSTTLIMSFLSGLMIDQIKYVMQKYAPVLAFLNPANAITDSFYSLYYYDTSTRFFSNIALLLGFSVVFYLGVYFVMRRQKYESI